LLNGGSFSIAEGGEYAVIATRGIRMLIRSDQSLLLLIDLQERLAPAIEAIDDVLRHNLWLVEIAQRMAVPVAATVQYPAGLGPMVPDLGRLATRLRYRQVVSAREAVRLIKDGDTVATGGFVGIGFAENIAIALEELFLEGEEADMHGLGSPRNLTSGLCRRPGRRQGARPQPPGP
jgi:hypothetical protein